MSPGEGKRNRAKGDRREYLVRDALRAMEFEMLRCRGSFGVWDLVGIGCNSGRSIYIQVGSNEWADPKKRAAMFAFPFSENNDYLFVRFDDRPGRSPRLRVQKVVRLGTSKTERMFEASPFWEDVIRRGIAKVYEARRQRRRELEELKAKHARRRRGVDN